MPRAERGSALSIFAVLFALLAVSNFLKPLKLGGDQTGFVLFGARLTGLANAVVGPLFGIFQLIYAYGIWTMRRFALPMAHAYALYVVINLFLFSERNPTPDTLGAKIFGIVYFVVAIGVSVGAAVMVTQRKAELT
jgi:hypothetical protein